MIKGLLKKGASGVLASFPCSRIASTLRAQTWLRPCWTDIFEQTLAFEGQKVVREMWLLKSALFNTLI